jgi:HAD superfamily hydrolase (TIGR01509 family)
MTRRTLVFDAGGVIIRWQPRQLVRHALPAFAHDDASAGAVAAAIFDTADRNADWAQFDLGLVEPEALAGRIAQRTGYPVRQLRTLIADIPEHLEPVPASLALLGRLHAGGHRLALLSNMPRPHAAYLEARHAFFGWFEACVFSGRVGLMKPERAMFDHVRRLLGLDLEHTLFIDDMPSNIDAARKLGWQALQFEDAVQCEAALLAGGWL